MTKKLMINELCKEFEEKQGIEKARWIYKQLSPLTKQKVQAQYDRLHGNVSVR